MHGAEPAAAPRSARHALVERVLDPGATEVLRLGAARGALPLPPQDLLYVQVHLLRDPVPAVADAARASLDGVSLEIVLPLLRDAACDPTLLDHFARSGRLKGEALAVVVAHPATPDATLEALASGGDGPALNLMVTNEVRLIANPGLVERLRANPALGADDRRRLAEIERDILGQTPLRPVAMPAPAPPPAEPEAPPAAGAAEMPAPEEAPGEAEPPPEAGFDPDLAIEEELQNTDAYQRILRMNVAERSLLAMKGNAEERAILIRDTARSVAHGVLKNPRLSETEITTYAAMRNIHEDILRSIASNREWTKTYAVALALVRNPKTPPGVSVQFIARLGTRDLKLASADKNVPELVRRNARNLYLARTQPPKKGMKKAH